VADGAEGDGAVGRLQHYGLVERHAEAPRRVEYSLTDLGRTLVKPIEVLTNWARDYGGAIVDFQEAAEAATRMLREGQADAALLHAPPDELGGLDTETLLTEAPVAVLPASHPLAQRASLQMADLARK
jgi:LysR substrate binding domain/HxlR-like helix-turn-helix